jgi:peptidoglycan hydrolase CwlO-like protein
MKKKLAIIMVLSMTVVTSPAFAAHDHGSPKPMDQGASQGSKDDPNGKECEKLLNDCAQYVGRIQQRIQKLHMEITGKHVGTSVRDELRKLEQHLKEANEIARSLQIM